MEDDEFVRQLMARAKKREAKLAESGESFQPSGPKVPARGIVTPTKQHINNNTYSIEQSEDEREVSYPPLSPLPEENDETDEEDLTLRQLGKYRQSTMTNLRGSPPSQMSDLNYSSDLSLECDDQEVYRAEPVLCHSSPPEQQRKFSNHDQPTPLQERGQKQQPQQQQQQQEQTLHHHHQQHLQPDLKMPTTSQSLPNSFSDKMAVDDLKARAELANHTKIQLRKAVEISKHGSGEHIEAARLLQIAENEHLAFSQRAAKLELGEYQRPDSLGSLKISGIELRMSSKLRNDLADESMSHYFMCIATCGTDVKATEVVDTNSIRKQDIKAYVQFKANLCFEDLPPDFNVKVEVFELIIGQHLPKLLSRLTPSKKSKISPDVTFKRVGSMKLTLADRKETYKKLTQWSENEKSKYIDSECKFSIELRSEQLPNKSGMLHVRILDNNSGRPDWFRFWVDLSGSQLRFWKSKQDSLDGKRPNQTIDIADLCSDCVQKLTPNDSLYRQNSFVLYSVQHMVGGEGNNLFQRTLSDDPKYKIMRHQLAAENKDDRDSWCAHLDKSMSCFREWHGRTRTYSIKDINEMFSC